MNKKDMRLERKKQRARENREFILEAAESVFANKGFIGATMDEIASEAQFSKATVYKYFSSKRDLIMAIIHHFFEEVSVGVRAIRQKDLSAEEKLKEHIEFICAFYHKKKNIVRVFIMEKFGSGKGLKYLSDDRDLLSPIHPSVPESLRIKMDEISKDITESIQEGITSGEFREVDPEDAGYIFGALIRGFHLQGPYMRRDVNPERSSELLFDFFLNGIKKV